MKYLVIDSAGRFFSKNQRFDTYYHNDAHDFTSLEEANRFVKNQAVNCEVSSI